MSADLIRLIEDVVEGGDLSEHVMVEALSDLASMVFEYGNSGFNYLRLGLS